MSISVTSASYDETTGQFKIDGTRPAGPTAVTVTTPGGEGSATLDDTTWTYEETLDPPPAAPISVRVRAGAKGITFEVTGSSITNISSDMPVGVTDASYDQVTGKVWVNGIREADFTAVTVKVNGGAPANATLEGNTGWKYKEILTSPPLQLVSVEVAAGDPVITFDLTGSNINNVSCNV